MEEITPYIILFFVDKSMTFKMTTTRMFAILAAKQHKNNTAECTKNNYYSLVVIIMMPDTGALYV